MASVLHSSGRKVRRLLSLGCLLLAGLAAAACGDSASDSGSVKKEVSTAIPASGCGSVPTPPPADEDGVMKGLGKEYQDGFAGYPLPVSKSVWADFKPDHPPPYKVGLAWGLLTTDVQVKNYEGLKKALADDPDIEVKSTTSEGVNVPQQLQQFQGLLNDKPDLMLVQPNADAFASLADKAGKQGIPTISLTNGSTNSDYFINIGPNNYLNGALAASVVLRQMGGKGNILLVHGIASTGVDQERFKAYKAAIKNCPDVKIVGEIAGAFNPSTAKAETLRYLATHPGAVDGVLQTSGMAPGVIDGFKQAGRPIPVVGDVGAMNGSLAYWSENKDSYSGFGLGFPQEDNVASQFALVKGLLAGNGLKISDIAAPYTEITTKNLGEWVKPGANLQTPGIADGPGGTYMGPDYVNGLFEKQAATK